MIALGHFYDKRTDRAHVDRLTVEALAGLSKTTFFEARREVCGYGLVQEQAGQRQGKYRSYPCAVYHLVTPVPPAPAEYVSRERDRYHPKAGTKESRKQHQVVPETGHLLRPERSPVAPSGDSPAVVSTQLGAVGVVEASEAVRSAIAQVVEKRLGSRGSPELVGLTERWARAVERAPKALREATLCDAAAAIAQAHGVTAADAREAVLDMLAILHPLVQEAARIFDAQIQEVHSG